MQRIIVFSLIAISLLYLAGTWIKSLRSSSKSKGHCSGCGKE